MRVRQRSEDGIVNGPISHLELNSRGLSDSACSVSEETSSELNWRSCRCYRMRQKNQFDGRIERP